MAASSLPNFVWWIIAIVVIALVVYVMLSKQTVDNIEIPGGVKLKFGPAARDESVTVTLGYDREPIALEGTATVYIDGKSINLAVDQGRSHVTASIKLPRAGTYGYRIEQREVWLVVPQSDPDAREPREFQSAGTGQIDVKPGSVFKITTQLSLGPGGTRRSSVLEPVQPEERRTQGESDLEKLERSVAHEE
jgi:hypothetical protein